MRRTKLAANQTYSDVLTLPHAEKHSWVMFYHLIYLLSTFCENLVTATENPRYWNYCWLKLLKTAFFWEKQFAPIWRHVVKSFFVRSERNKLVCNIVYVLYFFSADRERKLDHFLLLAKNHLYHLDLHFRKFGCKKGFFSKT